MGTEIDVEFLSSLVLPATLAFFAFILRFSIRKEKIVAITFVVDIIAAIFVGVLASVIIEPYNISDGFKWLAVTVAAMAGPELLAGVLHTSAMFSRSPVTFVIRILRIIKGKPLTKEELVEMTKWERDFIKDIDNENENKKR